MWTSQQDIYNEIENNIAVGHALGLPFDPTEYLSGEHSGLFFLPQQPTDNPNFGPALAQAGIKTIGSDASRDNVTRQVGTATTIPRHPTALYYNTSTQAQAVDEYNWLYTTRADGGSGYCEDNPATATCITPLDPATGFTSYIVPTDAAFDMNFILSNDPRPFYAHTSNLTADRLAYNLLDTILGTYRNVFTPATPLANLTLTDAANQLTLQTQWSTAGANAVTGYVQSGQITITNSSGQAVPFTAPTGTTVVGAALQPYGGEVSAWLAPGSTTGTLPGSAINIAGSTTFVIGRAGTITITATGVPTPTVSLSGALPVGLTFTPTPGAGTISGTPAVGTAGSYPVTITAVSGATIRTRQLVLTVAQLAQFTSAASASTLVGTPFSFTVTTTASPVANITKSGSLPNGITFRAGAGGTATLSGTPSTAGTFPITFSATNSGGTVRQSFTLTVGRVPSFTSGTSTTALVGQQFTFTVRTAATPTASITMSGVLPTGITFSPRNDGTARLSGTPRSGTAGTYTLVFTATNIYGTATSTFTLIVR